MTISDKIYKLRAALGMSQEQFANLFNVSRQSVQKWENGSSTPELSKVIEISKYFDISLDALLLGRDTRMIEEMSHNKELKPNYFTIPGCEFYAAALHVEYEQCIDEGLDIEAYKNVFLSVERLPQNEIKKELGDALFKLVINAKQKENCT
jgi:transcriptional regulator with XRE-family HTH domain